MSKLRGLRAALGRRLTFGSTLLATVLILTFAIAGAGTGAVLKDAGTSPTAAAVDTAKQSPPRLLSFKGSVFQKSQGSQVWRGSAIPKSLAKTSPAFKQFLRKRLNQMWRADGAQTDCARSYAIRVHRYLSTGYAMTLEIVHAHGGDPGHCSRPIIDGLWNLGLYAKSSQGWGVAQVTPGPFFSCAAIAASHAPSLVAGPRCVNEAGTKNVAYGRDITLKLKFQGCRSCSLVLMQDIGTGSWFSTSKKLHPNGAVTFHLRKSKTYDLQFMAGAKWAHQGYGTEGNPTVATRYQNIPVGHTVTEAQAKKANKATVCWAGTLKKRVSIPFNVQHFNYVDEHGKKSVAWRMYPRHELDDGAAEMYDAWKGTLALPNNYFCSSDTGW
jgi:hypothetical protein